MFVSTTSLYSLANKVEVLGNEVKTTHADVVQLGPGTKQKPLGIDHGR